MQQRSTSQSNSSSVFRNRKLLASIVAVPLVSGLMQAPAFGVDAYWDTNADTPGAGSNVGLWGTDSFWTADPNGATATSAWVAGDRAIFSAGSDLTGPYTLGLTPSVPPAVTTIDATGGVLVEEGHFVQTDGTINTGAADFTINSGASWSINLSTRLSSSGKVVLNGGTMINTNPGNAGSFVSALRAIEVNGTGTVNYTSSGTATVTIYAGTLLGTGGTTTNGGAGTLIKTGAHEFRAQNAGMANNTFAKLVVNQGLYRLGNVAGANHETAFGAAPLAELADAITLDGGQLGTSVSTVMNALRGITIGPAGGTFNGGGGGVLTTAAPISGSGTLNVIGRNLTVTSTGYGGSTGGITLNNPNNTATFTGKVNVDTSTLTLNESLNAAAFSGTHVVTPPPPAGNPVTTPVTAIGTVTIASTKVFTVGSDNSNTSYDGRVTGTGGTLTKIGTGTLTMSTVNATAFNGEWTVSNVNIEQGALKFGTSAAGFGNAVTLNIGTAGTLDMNGINDTLGAINGDGPIINGANVTINGGAALGGSYSGNYTGTGNFTKSGAGSQELRGSNTFGTVTLNNGLLSVNSSNALGSSGTNTLVLNSATGSLRTIGPVTSPSRPVTLNANGGTIDTAGYDSSFGVASGTGNLTKNGPGKLTFNSVNTTGTVTVGEGTLAIATSVPPPPPNDPPAPVPMLQASALTVNSGATLNMNNNDMIINYTGTSPEFVLRDLVKLWRDGGGTQGIAYTRAAGTPEDPDDKILAFTDAGEAARTSFNNVTVDDTTILGKYTYYGDGNFDGQITTDDYVAVDQGLNTGNSWNQGDYDLNGVVTTDDYVVVDLNMGKGTSNPLAFADIQQEMIALHTEMFGDSYVAKLNYAMEHGWVAASVPEPGAISALGIGALSLLRRRRRGC